MGWKMDWNCAVDKHRKALKGVLAMLVALAGFAGENPDPRAGGGPKTLPRRLHRALMRLLRPAEAAARRLIIIAARDLTVELSPRPRKQTPKPKSRSAFLTKPGGTGILLPRGMRPPGARPVPRMLALPLFDALPRWKLRPRRPVAHCMPRITMPGATRLSPLPPPPSPGDPIDAGRLHRRLAGLARALDDLPREARRFARWRAASDAMFEQSRNPAAGAPRRKPRSRRLSPLRAGRPPGWRKPGSARAEPVHETLNDLHGLAFWALEEAWRQRKAARPPDTS